MGFITIMLRTKSTTKQLLWILSVKTLIRRFKSLKSVRREKVFSDIENVSSLSFHKKITSLFSSTPLSFTNLSFQAAMPNRFSKKEVFELSKFTNFHLQLQKRFLTNGIKLHRLHFKLWYRLNQSLNF